MFLIQMLVFCFVGVAALWMAVTGFKKAMLALSLVPLILGGGFMYLCWKILARITGYRPIELGCRKTKPGLCG
jgi:hypothetical protein